MKRIDAIDVLMKNLPEEYPAICATGMISREVFTAGDRETNFYMVGSMSYNSSIGIGIAFNKSDKKVFVIDGDGSVLMNMGNLALVGFLNLENYFHIVLDNESYSSTGKQRCISEKVEMEKIAKSAGYKEVFKITDITVLKNKIEEIIQKKGPVFLLIKVESGNLEDIGRVTHTPQEIRDRFKNTLL